jgi:hypothetical protein
MSCRPFMCGSDPECADRPRKDIAGQRFGRWTVVQHIGRESASSRDHRWLCRCDCGTERSVKGSDLRAGKSASCGCAGRERSKLNRPFLKHGLSRTPTYVVWCGMRERCNCATHKDYPDYGGRGIKVCARWNDYAAFLADMGERPAGLTIERRDTDGDYEPSNCYWATYTEQNNNRRFNVFLERGDRRQTVAQWAHEFGLHPDRLRARLKRGWPLEKALTQPIRRWQ